MSLLKRISTITKAALHEGLNKLEKPGVADRSVFT